jgi:hypothetical protein
VFVSLNKYCVGKCFVVGVFMLFFVLCASSGGEFHVIDM